jgi:glucose/mannose-6-phosphate isomerase
VTLADEAVLDDVDELAARDPQEMLRLVATSGAQLREGALLAREAGIAAVAEAGRPRALVVTGMGGSGISGDVLAAVLGMDCPVPVVVHRGHGLPGWVGVADLVVAVSCSGATEETLSAAEEAARRGCPLVGVARPDSPLAELTARARGVHVPVRTAGQPRAALWSLTAPLLVLAEALTLVTLGDDVLNAAADRMDAVADRCRLTSESFVNPAKLLAAELARSLPLIWGSSPVGGVAAYRFSCQLNENAKYAGMPGVLPEVCHNQVVALDGALAGGSDALFRDRVDDDDERRLRIFLLRDAEEHPQVARRRAALVDLAAQRGVPVSELAAEGTNALERLASLVVLADFATVYLALLLGVDPTPVAAIEELKERVRE